MDYSFSDVNNFIVSMTSAVDVLSDGELLSQHNQNANILKELKTINQFNAERIDGTILMHLVKYEKFETIIENRKKRVVIKPIIVAENAEDVLQQPEKKKERRKKNTLK